MVVMLAGNAFMAGLCLGAAAAAWANQRRLSAPALFCGVIGAMNALAAVTSIIRAVA